MTDLVSWLDEHFVGRHRDEVGAAARALSKHGLLDLPFPGAGRTAERFASLMALGRADLSLARVAEGHLDAAAILAELGHSTPVPGELWGMWAADPKRKPLVARESEGGWRLDGQKPWCSGAGACTHLISAHAPDGYRLFAVDTASPGLSPEEGTWDAAAMPGCDSRTLQLDGVAAIAVGAPGEYLSRPGFWHGAIGVAAVWLGGSEAVAAALGRAHRRRPLDVHGAVHTGAVATVLHGGRSVLATAASAIDADRLDHGQDAQIRALAVRAVVERAATEVIDRVGPALGPAPLATDREHAHRVADLGLYLRQSHRERDWASLGAAVLDRGRLA